MLTITPTETRLDSRSDQGPATIVSNPSDSFASFTGRWRIDTLTSFPGTFSLLPNDSRQGTQFIRMGDSGELALDLEPTSR